MRGATLTVAIAWLWACGGDDAPAQGVVQSGARIRAMYFVDDAGGRVLRGWFDRARGEPCAWTEDDAPRCVPPHVETGLFADPACTQPLLALDPGFTCARPPYLAVHREQPCGDPTLGDIWTVSDELHREPTIYRTDGLQPCRAEAAIEGVEYHRAGRRLADGELATGRLVRAGDGRIQTVTIVGADGALVPTRALDRELDTRCWLVPGSGCAPPSVGAYLFEDDACSRPLAMDRTDCRPQAIAVDDGDRWQYFARGPLVTDDPTLEVPLFDRQSLDGPEPVCAPVARAPWEGYGFYRRGAPLSLASVARERAAGSFIDVDWLVTGGHRELEVLRLAGDGAACEPQEVAAGTWRCLPSLALAIRGVAYADERCTIAIDVAVELVGLTAPDEPARESLRPDACTPELRVYEQGAARAADTTFVLAADTCMPAPTAWMSFALRYRDLGAETTLDRFPRLTPVTE